jgi:hypothetical protein
MKNQRSFDKIIDGLSAEELARAAMLEAREAMEDLETAPPEQPLRSLFDASHRLKPWECQRFDDLKKAGFNAMLYIHAEAAAASSACSLWGVAALGAQGWEIAAEIARDAGGTLFDILADRNLSKAAHDKLSAALHALRDQVTEARTIAAELNEVGRKAKSAHNAAVARVRERAAAVAVTLGGEIDIVPQRITTAIAEAAATFESIDQIYRKFDALSGTDPTAAEAS